MDKYNIFLQGSEMTAEVWQNTAAKIIKLGLKEGSTFTMYPFNFFGTEKSTNGWVDEIEAHHNKHLQIVKIDYKLPKSWNESVNAIIDIYIEFLKN